MKTSLSVMLVAVGLLQAPTSSAQTGALDEIAVDMAMGRYGRERLVHARNVALGFDIGFDTGFDFTMNPPSAEDREALYAVRKELEGSGRYRIVGSREAADLLIAIRVRCVRGARSVSTTRRDGLNFRSSGSATADVLSVYEARTSQVGRHLWKGILVEGLSGGQPPLLARFQADVEMLARQR